ncbi:MAG TPA: hypothetical protein VFN81_09160, partial [Sphingomicrobium sp.]|nr:hypothetical protein [Sphingomicrobium sp.]
DVMAQMFERDATAFTEEFEPGLEPGIPAAAENPGTPEEAEVGTEAEEAPNAGTNESVEGDEA